MTAPGREPRGGSAAGSFAEPGEPDYAPRRGEGRSATQRGSLSGGWGGGANPRLYALVFALVILVLGLGFFGVLSICRDAVSRSATRAVETARAQPPAPTQAPSFPPPIPPTATPTPTPGPSLASSPSPGPAASTSPVAGARVHTVQAGDTLFGIAQRYNLTVDDLLRVNPDLTRQTVLQIGQQINLP